MKDPLINVLTRTSGRPNCFKEHVDSLREQTYKNINHIVCTDDKASEPYLKKEGVKDFIYIDREALINNDGSEKAILASTKDYFPQNLYFNSPYLIDRATEGWVIYLDDDDRFATNTSVEDIANLIKQHNEDTLIYFQMYRHPSGQVLPANGWNLNPTSCGIGGSCFSFNVKYKKHAVWDNRKCSDFRVIQKLQAAIPHKAWEQKQFIYVRQDGIGLRKDC